MSFPQRNKGNRKSNKVDAEVSYSIKLLVWVRLSKLQVFFAEMSKNFYKHLRASNVFDSLKVLRLFTILNGLIPFYLSDDGRRIKLRIVSVIIAAVHYIFYLVCTVVSVEEGNEIYETFFKSNVSSFASFTYGIVSAASISSIFLLSLLRRKYFRKIINTLIEVDERLQDLGIKLKYNKIVKLTIFMLSILVIFIFSYHSVCLILFKPISNTSLPLQMSFLCPYIFIWIYVQIFITLIFTIKICLKEINLVRKLHTFRII